MRPGILNIPERSTGPSVAPASLSCVPSPPPLQPLFHTHTYACTGRKYTQRAHHIHTTPSRLTLRYLLAAALSKGSGWPPSISFMLPICTPRSFWSKTTPDHATAKCRGTGVLLGKACPACASNSSLCVGVGAYNCSCHGLPSKCKVNRLSDTATPSCHV